jgi:hypothetical protein
MRVEGNRWRERGPLVTDGDGVVEEDLDARTKLEGCGLDQTKAGGTRRL